MGTGKLLASVFLFSILIAQLSFCWDAALFEAPQGTAALSDGRAMAYGYANIYIINPATGAFTYYASQFNFSSAPIYADNLNYVVGYGEHSLFSLSLLNGKKAETAFGSRQDSAPSSICYAGQGIFYTVRETKDGFDVDVLKLEFNGSFTALNSSSFSGSAPRCIRVAGIDQPILSSDSGIIVPKDRLLSSYSIVPIKSVSTNAVYANNRIYAGSPGGLLASFSDSGRIYDTASLADNPMYLYSDGESVLAYGSSGRMYILSANLTVINSTKVPAGIITSIYPSSPGYALLMTDRLVALDNKMEPVGDFTISPDSSSASFSNGYLITSSGSLLQGTQFRSGCSMSSPEQYAEIGYVPFAVSGRAFSIDGLPSIEISANGGAWEKASGSESWNAGIDPNNYPFGTIAVKCRASSQADARFLPSLSLYRSPSAQKNTFFVGAPLNMESGKEYAILVYDLQNSSVKNFDVSVNGGQNSTISSNRFSFTPSSPGDYKMVLTKDGFEDGIVTLHVGGLPLLLILIVGAAAAIAAAYMFFSFFKK
jgi:hypothetical protein